MVKTTDFGAFVSLLPGRDGLVHISKLGRGKRIAKVEDVVKVGDKLRVEIADIDNRGKISLVLVAEEDTAAAPADTGPRRPMPRPPQLVGKRRLRRGPQRQRGDESVSAAHHAAGRPARRHRVHPVGALGIGRRVGGRRVARRGSSVAGAAHFLEHLLFKSTPTRTRGRDRPGGGRGRR